MSPACGKQRLNNKMVFKSIIRKLIPRKILFLRRVIRDRRLKQYLAGLKQFRKDKKLGASDLPLYLSIAAIVKNETPYIAEWIEYHLLVGVRKFFIYDNESTDNLSGFLKPYIDEGIVEYILFPGKRRQVAAYNDAIQRFKYASFWLAFIDIDEFLIPLTAKTLPKLLCDFDDVPGIEINQVLYGSSGHPKKTEGLVIERFTHHSRFDAMTNRGGKSIVNPRCVLHMATPHIAEYFDGECSVDTHKNKNILSSIDRPPLHDTIRLNHYGTKSFEEFTARIDLGKVYYPIGNGPVETKIPVAEFYNRDLNDITDDAIMEKYIPAVKERLRRRNMR
jgi:hypothetical protein